VKLNPLKTGAQRAASLLICGFLVAPILSAQSTNALDAPPKGFWQRLSLGVRLSIFATDILPSGTTTTYPYDNDSLAITQTTQAEYSHIGGGVTVEYAVSRRVLVSADLLYHKFGYTAKGSTLAIAADGTISGTSSQERTHARYWDLPVVIRFTNLGDIGAARAFLGAGMALRRITNITTSGFNIDEAGNTVINNAPRAPLNQTIYGVIAAAGVRAVDDFGIKVTPELRYIYWFGNIFGSWPGQQRRNELQVLLGITF
jgi:hypothetical protein